MKKAKSELNDWGRPEYKRSDFGKLERGKYAKRVRESTNVVVLEPEVAKAFPNDKAVNKALRGLISADRPQTRRGLKGRPKKTAANGKRRAA
jgi:hypothetical protein